MRLFVAIDLPDEYKLFLNELNKAFENFKSIKPVDVENMHLTLLYLGDKVDPKVVVEKLKQVEFEPFNINVKGFGFFPNEDKIRVAYSKILKCKELMSLQSKIASIFDDKQEYIPHVTFARMKNLFDEKDAFSVIIENYKNKEFSFSVNKFRLYNSELTSLGPIHGVVSSFLAQDS